ncbi:hypothetical protein B0E45_32270 [Sinorhizobium sp. A49]|uniref:hypothetical protein n=1 Tax=Sinorhizobium sp. A49 TaxID=1945861 RepID=UPI0009848984|nr:hypothetical protein [Sinorhizobium sp. A49]OOG61815.1 hypothetical protein B0E45_32270 [Sinorhizobium sp. A49]
METHHRATQLSSPNCEIYSLDEFAMVYDLSAKRALQLYKRFGPMRSKLDTLMLAIRRSRNSKP